MIKLSQVISLEKLNIALTRVKTYVDDRISALAQSVSSVMEDVDSSINTLEAEMATKGNCEMLTFTNTVVAASAWAGDTTYSKYPYRAAITCAGVTANHIPDIVFHPDDADSLNYSRSAATGSNIVYIYAKEKPTASITIPTIKAERAVN